MMFDKKAFYGKGSTELLGLNDVDIRSLGRDMYVSVNDAKSCLLASELDRCMELCDTLLDILWEHLNTGHWKEVSFKWRKGYTIVSYIKAMAQLSILEDSLMNSSSQVGSEIEYDVQEHRKLSEELKAIIKTCDMGLLMGYSTPSDPLATLATHVHTNFVQKIIVDPESETLPNDPPTKKMKITPLVRVQGIKVVYRPSLEYFGENFYNCREPVILKGCMDDWPAMGKWTINYLNKVAGWRVVPIELGSKYTDDAWSQKLMTVEEFIKQYLVSQNKDTGYLAQHQLFDQISDLRKDVLVPDYCALSEDGDVEMNAWFGPSNTISPLHRDEKDNIFCQVSGEKYFKLYDPMYTDKLHVHDNHLLKTTSMIDVEHPDLDLFPEFPQIPYAEFTLSAGDMLFIPCQHWHYVRSLTTSFSVSFWWIGADRVTG